MKQLNDFEFPELQGASLNEKKQVLHLANSRYQWYRDMAYLRLMICVVFILITISLLILTILPSTLWLVPVVLVGTFISGAYLRSAQAKRIKPLLSKALSDVREHKYR